MIFGMIQKFLAKIFVDANWSNNRSEVWIPYVRTWRKALAVALAKNCRNI